MLAKHVSGSALRVTGENRLLEHVCSQPCVFSAQLSVDQTLLVSQDMWDFLLLCETFHLDMLTSLISL